MSTFLPKKVSKGRLRKAEIAPRKRLDIAKAFLHRLITRRDLLKWGLSAGAGALGLKHGLNPFVDNAPPLATNFTPRLPTGLPATPVFGGRAFPPPPPPLQIPPPPRVP